MSIQDWGAVGELVGGVTVIVTLIYLAVQLRQTQLIMRAQAFQARSEALTDLTMRAAECESISMVQVKLLESGFRRDPTIPDSLTPLERVRFANYLTAHLHRVSNLVHQHEAGMLSDEYYEVGIKAGARNFYPQWKAFGVLGFQIGLEQLFREVTGEEGAAKPNADVG